MFFNGTAFTVMSPLGSMITQVYEVHMMLYNLNSLLMILLYIPSNFFLANFIFKKYGVHAALCIGVGFNCLFLWLRTLINENFTLAMCASFFYGISQPLIINSLTEIASNWFATNEVFYITFEANLIIKP